eukprot:s233_g2.t1
MSQAPSSGQNDDEVSLGLAFQGLQISIRGPGPKALAFIKRVTEDLQDFPHSSSHSSASSQSLPATSPVPPCPSSLLALANKLSAASILSPKERVLRAWQLGISARRQIEGQPGVEEPVISIDLPNNFFAVVRCSSFEGAKIIRSAGEFKRILGSRSTPSAVGHGFPSETEARVYLVASGQDCPVEDR